MKEYRSPHRMDGIPRAWSWVKATTKNMWFTRTLYCAFTRIIVYLYCKHLF